MLETAARVGNGVFGAFGDRVFGLGLAPLTRPLKEHIRSTAGAALCSFRSRERCDLNPPKLASFLRNLDGFGFAVKNTHTVRTSPNSRHAKIAKIILFKKGY